MALELSGSAGLPANATIAVMPFGYGDQKKSDVGMMVSERLTTRIVKLKKSKVIERQMLENVLKELHLEGTGVVDAATTQEIGKVLGVDAIVTGTVLDLDADRAEINARVIKTDTAEVIASASAEVPATWAAASGTASKGKETGAVKESKYAAHLWLSLIDTGDYAESYAGTSEYFKTKLARGQWLQTLETVRSPLGKVNSRVLRDAVNATKLPEMPAGTYVILFYDTSFVNKPVSVETVTVSKEKNGTWAVAGYYIKW
jgi:TolB-like protein